VQVAASFGYWNYHHRIRAVGRRRKVMCITVVFTIETLTINIAIEEDERYSGASNIAIEEDERYSGASSSKPWAPHDFSHCCCCCCWPHSLNCSHHATLPLGYRFGLSYSITINIANRRGRKILKQLQALGAPRLFTLITVDLKAHVLALTRCFSHLNHWLRRYNCFIFWYSTQNLNF
jgi:hypothetical protein